MHTFNRCFTVFLIVFCFSVHVSAQNKALKVVSYNIRYSSAKSDGGNCWVNRRSGTLTMLEREKPDLLGLQEALSDQLDYISEHMPSYGYVGVGRDDGKRKGESMAVFYNRKRMKLLRHATFWLSETPDSVSRGWDGVCRRTVTCTLFKDRRTGKKVAFLNTHLDHKGEQARRNGVLLLCRLISEWVPKGVPVVLGGDMNSTTDDDIFVPLRQQGIEDARVLSPLTDERGTYHGWGKEEKVIDHFFVRGMKVHRFLRLDGDYGVPYLSDHYPIEIVIDN